jgi:putative solute:sodium symporter small subunit
LWSEKLDSLSLGGFKLGFWFSQQGSIYFFVLIIFTYVYLLNKLDKKHFDNPNKSNTKEK